MAPKSFTICKGDNDVTHVKCFNILSNLPLLYFHGLKRSTFLPAISEFQCELSLAMRDHDELNRVHANDHGLGSTLALSQSRCVFD